MPFSTAYICYIPRFHVECFDSTLASASVKTYNASVAPFYRPMLSGWGLVEKAIGPARNHLDARVRPTPSE